MYRRCILTSHLFLLAHMKQLTVSTTTASIAPNTAPTAAPTIAELSGGPRTVMLHNQIMEI